MGQPYTGSNKYLTISFSPYLTMSIITGFALAPIVLDYSPSSAGNYIYTIVSELSWNFPTYIWCTYYQGNTLKQNSYENNSVFSWTYSSNLFTLNSPYYFDIYGYNLILFGILSDS